MAQRLRLDVQILSPPHTLLFLGLRLVSFGFLLLLVGAMNRAAEQDALGVRTRKFKTLQGLFLYLGGLIVMGHMLLLTQSVDQTMLHGSTAYEKMALGLVVMLPLLWQASRSRWAATIAALVYTVLRIAEVLIFPLFPATPRLGPVLNPITHMVPAQFPILILVPAFALDLLLQRTGGLRPAVRALASGVVFVVTLVAVEWPFASFLHSHASENRFFDTLDFDFSAPLADRVHQFSFVQAGWPLFHGLLLAVIYAACASWVGLRMGSWMRSLQR